MNCFFKGFFFCLNLEIEKLISELNINISINRGLAESGPHQHSSIHSCEAESFRLDEHYIEILESTFISNVLFHHFDEEVRTIKLGDLMLQQMQVL
jgi:hypothetical protein